MRTMQRYKGDFPLLMQDKTVYIDNAATAQRPQCVINATEKPNMNSRKHTIMI